jgi:tetratricopeptide (TPR) repeat protein/tRNA A-37 threonylcarbamoyl transferase component Bud32
MSQAAIAMQDLVGSSVGRFAIMARLGYGGMGEVYLAEDCVLKRRVAMKSIKQGQIQNAESQLRLVKEAERASQLNDEHIARIHDIVEQDGSTFLIMEYVEGETLRDRLQEPLPLEEFFCIAEQCLAGLMAAHNQGILHCDLKPENLMITPTGQVKILDFGFARRIESDETRESLELSKIVFGGTPGYMAPEVLLGNEPDERADIFAIGVVLYEALAGCHPFRLEGHGATAGRILHQEPCPLPATVPAALQSVLRRMLEKDPAQRYQTCADALADIRAVHAGRKPALPKSRWTKTQLLTARLAVVALVTVLAVLLAARWLWKPGSAVVNASSRQLVVLPFQPVTDDANSRAFASGLTETMAAKLGEIADRYPLEIVATADARNVKDAQQARTVLGATLALEGSMQLSGNTVRVSYRLVDTQSMRQLHSGVITADAANVFAVQDRVIEQVLGNLDIELAKEDRGRMESHGTSQLQAYDSYLRGRGYLQDYDRAENLEYAIAAFQRSLAADPKFALAFAGLGQAYIHKYSATYSAESLSLAKNACSRAAELDPASPDGELCLGMLFNSTGEYGQAAQHLERAVKLDPYRDESYRELGLTYERLQRLDDAESVLKKSIALRPQYWAGYRRLGWFYSAHGRNDEAIEQFKRVVALAPDSSSAYSNLGGIYVIEGRYAEAIDVLQRSTAIRPTGGAWSNLGVAYFYERRYQEAVDSYSRAATMLPNEYAAFGNLAEAYAQLGDKQDESRKNYSRALELAEQQLSVNNKDSKVLLDAAVYAAMLGQQAKAEEYRKSGLKLSALDPQARLNSAVVLAEFHQDSAALAELDQALKAGLSPTQITNNPAWQRFAVYPQYLAMTGTHKK